MLVSLGGGAGRSYTLHPYRFLVIITRVHFFNAESINDLHKRLSPSLTIGLGQATGGERLGRRCCSLEEDYLML